MRAASVAPSYWQPTRPRPRPPPVWTDGLEVCGDGEKKTGL